MTLPPWKIKVVEPIALPGNREATEELLDTTLASGPAQSIRDNLSHGVGRVLEEKRPLALQGLDLEMRADAQARQFPPPGRRNFIDGQLSRPTSSKCRSARVFAKGG